MKKIKVSKAFRFSVDLTKLLLNVLHANEEYWLHNNYALYNSINEDHEKIIQKLYYCEAGDGKYDEICAVLSNKELLQVVRSLLFSIDTGCYRNKTFDKAVENDIARIKARPCRYIESIFNTYKAERFFKNFKKKGEAMGYDPVENHFKLIKGDNKE